MQTLEEQLKEFGFLRVHSGYIVNMKYIRLIEPSHILLTNGDQIPVSRKNATNIKAQFLSYKQKNGNVVF